MRNRFAAVAAIALFLAVLTLPTALHFAGVKSPDGLQKEKRQLADFPAAFSDHILEDLETWYKDHAPYRLLMIDRQKKVAQAYGTPYRRHVHPFLSEVFTPDWYREYCAARGDDAPFLAPLSENQALYGRGDWLYCGSRASIKGYTHDNLLSEKRLKAWRDDFLALKAACDARGIRLLITAAPEKEQVYPEYMPSFLVHGSARRQELVTEYMRREGLPYFDLLPDLLAAKGERELYFRQDSHWNYLGAFTGVMALYRELGMPTCALEDLNVELRPQTGGDLSNFVGFRTTYDAYTVDYKPEVEVSTADYGTGECRVYTSNSENDHKLVLVGDSFRLACVHFLPKDFRVSSLVHRKAIGKDITARVVRDLSEGDVLIIMIVERFDEESHKVAARLAEILTEPQPDDPLT